MASDVSINDLSLHAQHWFGVVHIHMKQYYPKRLVKKYDWPTTPNLWHLIDSQYRLSRISCLFVGMQT